jgi:hypothetical protein
MQLLSFCAFEGLVGVFWPSMMTMRSAYVPEEMRATIINFFRIPLNLFVCVILYNVSNGARTPVCGRGRRALSLRLPAGRLHHLHGAPLFPAGTSPPAHPICPRPRSPHAQPLPRSIAPRR